MKILSEHGRNLHEFEEDAGTCCYRQFCCI